MTISSILNVVSLISVSTVAFMALTLWALWILYVAMMNIDRAMEIKELPLQAKLLVYPTKFVFDFVEIVANSFVCTLIFLDLPKEFTVSDRLRRYYEKQEQAGWRMVLVNFVKPMLDPFDHKGPHI